MIPKIWSMADRIFSRFGPNSPENQNCEKLKKTPGDIIILHKCTIKENHIWFLRYEVQQTELFCHPGPSFALLPP